jgi:methionyl-tRNA formyltransferase
MSPLRIAFLGSDGIALPLLEWLTGPGASQITVVAVYTQPDRPVGRGQKVTANAIKTWAVARGIPVFQPEKLTEEVRAQFASLHVDLSLVMAYGHILRDDFIATPRLGTLNLHASILPRYRGASPIQTAIANGENETGVSLMRIVRRLDAGPVADVERVSIAPLDTALDIEGKLAAVCVPLVSRNLAALMDGSLEFVAQDEGAATFCRRLEKGDGVLDFSAPAGVLAARINGLFPWPACAVEVGGQPIKFGLADVIEGQTTMAPGSVLGTDEAGLLLATGAGALRLRRLQRPGGKMLPAAEFLRGHAIETGSVIPSTPMPALVGNAPFKK